jgi:hypothetical protein
MELLFNWTKCLSHLFFLYGILAALDASYTYMLYVPEDVIWGMIKKCKKIKKKLLLEHWNNLLNFSQGLEPLTFGKFYNFSNSYFFKGCLNSYIRHAEKDHFPNTLDPTQCQFPMTIVTKNLFFPPSFKSFS